MSAVRICFIAVFSFLVTENRAQDMDILRQLPAEEQNAVEAIALYPAQQREAILVASLYPEILVRMENIRNATEIKFKEAISGLAREDQQRMYNLSRYPDLIAKMCFDSKARSHADMLGLLQPFPEDIHADALYVNQQYAALLRDIHALYLNAETAFQTVLSAYPDSIRHAYMELDQLPGVTSILTNNMKMTVLLGDLYDKYPVEIMHVLDSLNLVVAEQQSREVEAWKQKLEADPEAMKEYESAAQAFASEAPYDDDVYDGPLPDRYTERVIVHEVWRPYPYWFGWPYWYADECWYPYPWWYHSGYYYGPGHVMVIIGMPSSLFFNWHFHHARHFYHYPHFTNQVIRHYYGPRKFGERVQPVFKRWMEDHQSELPSRWFDDDQKRVDRIREWGKFQMDYEKKVGPKTEQSPTQREFLKKYADRYPTLKPVLIEKPEPPRKPQTKDVDVSPAPPYQPRQTEPRTKATPEEKIDRARENHENVWDNQRKPDSKVTPKPNPPKKEQPPNAPRTKKEEPKQTQAPPRTAPTKKRTNSR